MSMCMWMNFLRNRPSQRLHHQKIFDYGTWRGELLLDVWSSRPFGSFVLNISGGWCKECLKYEAKVFIIKMWSEAFSFWRCGCEITATVLDCSVSRWNGMRPHRQHRQQHRRIVLFRDGNSLSVGLCPARKSYMRCIYRKHARLQTPSWQNVPKWQRRSTKDMAWMELQLLMGSSRKRRLKLAMCKGDASNFLKVPTFLI